MNLTIRQYGHNCYLATHTILGKHGISFKPMDSALSARHLTVICRLVDSTQLDKALKSTDSIALESGSPNVFLRKNRYFLDAQFELPYQLWQSFTRSDIGQDDIGISRISRRLGNQTVKFELLDSRPHSLFAGTTGSGKTEAMKSSLVALMNSYTPNQLGIGIVDVKRSKYKDFANTSFLVAPIAKDSNEIDNLIMWFGEQFRLRRQDSIFASDGAKRLVLVLDESQDDLLLGMKDRHNEQNLRIVHKLVTQGRDYGIHIIIGTQKPSRDGLPKILDNLDNRYTGKVVDAKASSNATGLPQLGAHKLTAQGDFLYIPDAFNVVRFQVAMATQSDYDALPRAIDVKPIKTQIDTTVLNMPTKQSGRPPKIVQPEMVARYLISGYGNISISKARNELGLNRTEHTRTIDFVKRLIKEVKRLKDLANRIENE